MQRWMFLGLSTFILLSLVLFNGISSAQQQPPRPTMSPDEVEARRMQERDFLPDISEVRRWIQVESVGEPENFAPSVVRLHGGGYRMYFNAQSQHGIGSAYSEDGLDWTVEAGVRLGNGEDGSFDCTVSHPWVVAVEDGYRMYYQAGEICNRQGDQSGITPIFRVMSAFSEDGLVFEREEGVRVDIGEDNGLSIAAHGRVLQLEDDSYRMWFSVNFIGVQTPADILGASSTDGLMWTLDDTPTLQRAHDPTVIQIEDTIYLYTTFLGDNFVVSESSDRYEFTPVYWLEFYDMNGSRIEEFGDADIVMTDDGQLYLYGTGKGSRGIGIFVADE